MTACTSCPYYNTCLARLIDTTITGCNMTDYVTGTITSTTEILVERTYVNNI